MAIKLLIVAVYLIRSATDKPEDVYCCERIYRDDPPVSDNGTCRSYLNLSNHRTHDHNTLHNKTFNFTYDPIIYVCRYFALWLLETIFSTL